MEAEVEWCHCFGSFIVDTYAIYVGGKPASGQGSLMLFEAGISSVPGKAKHVAYVYLRRMRTARVWLSVVMDVLCGSCEGLVGQTLTPKQTLAPMVALFDGPVLQLVDLASLRERMIAVAQAARNTHQRLCCQCASFSALRKAQASIS